MCVCLLEWTGKKMCSLLLLFFGLLVFVKRKSFISLFLLLLSVWLFRCTRHTAVDSACVQHNTRIFWICSRFYKWRWKTASACVCNCYSYVASIFVYVRVLPICRSRSRSISSPIYLLLPWVCVCVFFCSDFHIFRTENKKPNQRRMHSGISAKQ